MRIAKPTERDIHAALDFAGAFEALQNGFKPVIGGESPPEAEEGDDLGRFDRNDPEQCQAALHQLLGLASSPAMNRMLWGMAHLLDVETRAVDPNDSATRIHPDRGQLRQALVRIAGQAEAGGVTSLTAEQMRQIATDAVTQVPALATDVPQR